MPVARQKGRIKVLAQSVAPVLDDGGNRLWMRTTVWVWNGTIRNV